MYEVKAKLSSSPADRIRKLPLQKILELFPDMERIVTTTSRSPRPNEKDRIDYYFVSPEEFHTLAEKGDFGIYSSAQS